MSNLAIGHLMKETAEFNRRVADSVEPEFWRAGKPDDAVSLRRRGMREARQLTRFTLSRSWDCRAAWDTALEVLGDGVAGEEATEVLQIARDIIDSWLQLAEKARAVWRDVAAATGAAPDGLEKLDKAEAEVKQVKSAADKAYAFLTRARPPVDPALLEQGREEISQGRYRTAEQVSVRLCPLRRRPDLFLPVHR